MGLDFDSEVDQEFVLDLGEGIGAVQFLSQIPHFLEFPVVGDVVVGVVGGHFEHVTAVAVFSENVGLDLGVDVKLGEEERGEDSADVEDGSPVVLETVVDFDLLVTGEVEELLES